MLTSHKRTPKKANNINNKSPQQVTIETFEKLVNERNIAVIRHGDNLTVGGGLYLRGTQIASLPDNLTVGGDLDLSGTQIASLPDNLTVGGGLDLGGTQIASLPDNLTVGGGLYLSGTQIAFLPDNLTVGGDLDLSGTQIASLPDNLTVGGDLDLDGTQIASLPDNLTVGGDLNLSRTQIATPIEVKKPPAQFLAEATAAIERKFNSRGYSIADGILARIISSTKGVKKIQIVGKKNHSYLVSDGNGNYSHGETIRQARNDLVYKAVAKFDGELPKSATGKEWVRIYRAVTGACTTGVKLFVEKSGENLANVFTLEQILKLIKGQYGEDKFNAAHQAQSIGE